MPILTYVTYTLTAVYAASVAVGVFASRFRERMRRDPYFRTQADKALHEYATEGTVWGNPGVALFMVSRRGGLLALAEVWRPPDPVPIAQVVAPGERLARALARRRGMRAYRKLYREATSS
jgi:hypothetical protein